MPDPIPASVDDPSPYGAHIFNLYDVTKVIQQHYLAALEYDEPAIAHGAGIKPVCACGTTFIYWMPTREDALRCYLGHVQTELIEIQRERVEQYPETK